MTRNGYVSLQFGQRRPFEPGRPAVESLELGAHFDLAFQESVKPRGRTFRITEGQTLTLICGFYSEPRVRLTPAAKASAVKKPDTIGTRNNSTSSCV